ncbi:MAG TPA: hypothetical protein VJN96_11955 [Vicinamibacterales bacterium]|nr:hypothetical protein [Vicinamibacterales bacterium]
MRTYVATTGVLFAAITVAHVWRAYEEGRGVAHDPFFLVLTALAAAFSVWALVLLRRR